MNKKDILEKIREAGVIGAGGAGFPTHIKLNCKAEYVLANGAECEPLLRVDRSMMENYPDTIITGLKAAMSATGAKKGYVCLKGKYKKAIAALEKAIEGMSSIEIFKMDNYYPAGDEQQMVYDVTGRVVPTGGLPLDTGVVVDNVSTLMNIASALNGKPVTHKCVTVTGEVSKPVTLNVPIGTPISTLIKAAGGPEKSEKYCLIVGGPLMGYIEGNWDAAVTKTTGGIIILPEDHKLISLKASSLEREFKMAKAVCCQCTYCTQMCPRNALGLKVEPHKAMRALAYNSGEVLIESNGIFSCCNCGVCTYYACPMGLSPSKVMTEMKTALTKKGMKPRKEVAASPNSSRDYMKIPSHRIIERMGLSVYDVDAPLAGSDLSVDKVKIGLKQNIGMPSAPVKSVGDTVAAGDLIASVEKGKVGADIHASIGGTITCVTADYIEITT